MKQYTVVIGGIEHTMQLTDDDAARLGATPVAQPKGKTASVENKARRTTNKAND